jgi:hypothetical protein
VPPLVMAGTVVVEVVEVAVLVGVVEIGAVVVVLDLVVDGACVVVGAEEVVVPGALVVVVVAVPQAVSRTASTRMIATEVISFFMIPP